MSLRDDQVEVAIDAIQVGRAAGVGRVVRGGARAPGLADRPVLVGPIDPCGECDVCRRGGAAVCPSAMRRDALAPRVEVAARWVVPLDDGLELPSPWAAAVAGDVSLAYTLYARAGVAPREPVVVVGACPIGRFLVEILLAKGIAPVALGGPDAWRAFLASRSVPVGSDTAALRAALDALDLGSRPWRVICADPAQTEAAIAIAGPRATLTALAGDAPAALSGSVLAREIAVTGVAGAHPDLMVEAAALCVRGDVDLLAGTTRTPGDPLRACVQAIGP